MTSNTRRGGTPQPAPRPDIAATIARYKERIEASQRDISAAETRLDGAKATLQTASSTISSALESSRKVSASLEGSNAGPSPQDAIGQRTADETRKRALGIGLVEHVISLAAGLNETLGRSIESLLGRAGELKKSIGTLGSFVDSAETISEPERGGYLQNLAPGFTLIERSAANLKRGVDETCASIAEHCDEKSIAVIMATEILAKVPPLPQKKN